MCIALILTGLKGDYREWMLEVVRLYYTLETTTENKHKGVGGEGTARGAGDEGYLLIYLRLQDVLWRLGMNLCISAASKVYTLGGCFAGGSWGCWGDVTNIHHGQIS